MCSKIKDCKTTLCTTMQWRAVLFSLLLLDSTALAAQQRYGRLRAILGSIDSSEAPPQAIVQPAAAASQPPMLCGAMLSYNRPHYLIPSTRAFISYMTAVEPSVSYVLQILDNGSGPQELKSTMESLGPLQALGFVRLVHLEKTVGLSRGFNLLFFDMCMSTKAQHILSLEDDWQARLMTWPSNFPVMQAAMQVLEKDPKMLQVWLRDVSAGSIHNVSSWMQQTVTTLQGKQLQVNMLHQNCKDVGSSPWGGWTNGASLIHVPQLQVMGRVPKVDGEAEYSVRSCQLGFHIAYVCQNITCFNLETQAFVGLFEHIGRSRVPQTIDARFSTTLSYAEKASDNETVADVAHHELLTLQASASSRQQTHGVKTADSTARGASSNNCLVIAGKGQRLLPSAGSRGALMQALGFTLLLAGLALLICTVIPGMPVVHRWWAKGAGTINMNGAIVDP